MKRNMQDQQYGDMAQKERQANKRRHHGDRIQKHVETRNDDGGLIIG